MRDAIPGSNNVLINNPSGILNVNTALPSTHRTKHITTNRLPQESYCFIVDIDIIPFVINTGTNRIVVNDEKLLHKLITTSDKIKGIGGKCM